MVSTGQAVGTTVTKAIQLVSVNSSPEPQVVLTEMPVGKITEIEGNFTDNELDAK